VAKGHDFERVTLVGVVAADLALGRPDFRAAERTFQLLTQVAGRAGRGKLAGEVLVETYYPEHYAIQYAVQQDYVSFYEKEAHFRRVLHYPPFTALATVLVRDRRIENAIRWSRQLAEYFAPFEKRGVRVLGPAAAPLSRFIVANPTLVMLALSFLLMIGMVLIADGFGVHVPKGYIYAAVIFSGAVEALNMRRRRRRKG